MDMMAATTSAPLSGVDVSIERLALHDFPPVHAARLEKAFVSELTRLLLKKDIDPACWTSINTDRVPRVSLTLATTPNDAVIGRQIAQAVFVRIKPQSKEMHR
jgi:hypothetical protein